MLSRNGTIALYARTLSGNIGEIVEQHPVDEDVATTHFLQEYRSAYDENGGRREVSRGTATSDRDRLCI